MSKFLNEVGEIRKQDEIDMKQQEKNLYEELLQDLGYNTIELPSDCQLDVLYYYVTEILSRDNRSIDEVWKECNNYFYTKIKIVLKSDAIKELCLTTLENEEWFQKAPIEVINSICWKDLYEKLFLHIFTIIESSSPAKIYYVFYN